MSKTKKSGGNQAKPELGRRRTTQQEGMVAEAARKMVDGWRSEIGRLVSRDDDSGNVVALLDLSDPIAASVAEFAGATARRVVAIRLTSDALQCAYGSALRATAKPGEEIDVEDIPDCAVCVLTSHMVLVFSAADFAHGWAPGVTWGHPRPYKLRCVHVGAPRPAAPDPAPEPPPIPPPPAEPTPSLFGVKPGGEA